MDIEYLVSDIANFDQIQQKGLYIYFHPYEIAEITQSPSRLHLAVNYHKEGIHCTPSLTRGSGLYHKVNSCLLNGERRYKLFVPKFKLNFMLGNIKNQNKWSPIKVDIPSRLQPFIIPYAFVGQFIPSIYPTAKYKLDREAASQPELPKLKPSYEDDPLGDLRSAAKLINFHIQQIHGHIQLIEIEGSLLRAKVFIPKPME